MKSILFAMALMAASSTAWAQQPKVYQCVRPDGTVVCNVTGKTGDPSVTCNYECVDCNMVCVARLKLADEGGALTPVAPPAVNGERRQPSPGAEETPEYCRQVYQQCVAKCKSDPMNKTKYDVDACVSSCSSWYSGCGMKP
ncbi:MAG: hypothetical protein ACOZEN_02910 [Thermodesulfobacteriota bacterium]